MVGTSELVFAPEGYGDGPGAALTQNVLEELAGLLRRLDAELGLQDPPRRPGTSWSA
jgi:hypothetical protein